jgi:D-sedoheptulose 7-phosphate isomerase
VSDIGFWVDSRAYNVVECTHMIWLTTVIDMLVGVAEYKVS